MTHWRMRLRAAVKAALMGLAPDRTHSERVIAVTLKPPAGQPDNLPAILIYIPESKTSRGILEATAEVCVEVWATGETDELAADARDALCAEVERALLGPDATWADDFGRVEAFDDETRQVDGSRTLSIATLTLRLAFHRSFEVEGADAAFEGLDGDIDVVGDDGADEIPELSFEANPEYSDP